MSTIGNAIAKAIAWVIQDNPGAWQKAIRDIFAGAIATGAAAWAFLTLWTPASVADAKVLALYLWVQVGIPVLWAVIGIARREIWPLIVSRLWGVVSQLRTV